MTNKRGLLIVVEGCDRSGKSTQCKMLAEFLNSSNIRTELHRFPNRTSVIGTMIDQYLKSNADLEDHTIHLLFSANRWEFRSDILKLLDAGVNVILDRYCYSGIAFSAAKGLDFEWCKAPDVGLPLPDLVFFLDLSMDQISQRGGFGQERYEKLDFQTKVRKNFHLLKESWWNIVDASLDPDSVHLKMRNTVLEAMNNFDSEKPVGEIN